MTSERPGFLAKVIAASIRNRVLILLFGLLLAGAGIWSLFTTPVDAIPDLSDAQVIVYTEYKGQSPRTLEDQVTYPLTTALVSVPGAKTVRGYSFFGYSLVYILFEDGIDPYWARSRVAELLNSAQKRLPSGVTPTLGPDGSGVGWVFEYALVSEKLSLQELRSLQDWYLKYGLASVEGVAEVASVGGYVKQYQVQVDPSRLRSFGVSLSDIEMAIRRANADAGGEVLEMGEAEYMVRGQGLLRGLDDLRKVPVKYDPASGIAVTLGELSDLTEGPEMRRGLAELDGLDGVADAMRRGRAGRADRVAEALDLVGGGKVGRDRARHGARHLERADPLGPLLLGGDRGLHDGAGGRSAGARDHAGTVVTDFGIGKTGVLDRLLHGEVGVGRAVAHEAHKAPVDQLFRIELQGAGDLAACSLERRTLGAHRDGSVHARHVQMERQVEGRARAECQRTCVFTKPRHARPQLVRSNPQVRESKATVSVGGRLDGDVRGGLAGRDHGARDGSALRVEHATANGGLIHGFLGAHDRRESEHEQRRHQ